MSRCIMRHWSRCRSYSINCRRCWSANIPPMIQRLIRAGLIIRVRVRVIRVWWEVVRVAVWLRNSWRRPRDWCWSG